MNPKHLYTPGKPLTIEIKYWSPSGIPFTPKDEELVLDFVRYVHKRRKNHDYKAEVSTVAFDLVNTGNEDEDHIRNFINIGKVCSYIPTKEKNIMRLVCLRENFPVQAMSALHDVYICQGSAMDVVINDLPKGFIVGIHGVLMPVLNSDGTVLRWTSIY